MRLGGTLAGIVLKQMAIIIIIIIIVIILECIYKMQVKQKARQIVSDPVHPF